MAPLVGPAVEALEADYDRLFDYDGIEMSYWRRGWLEARTLQTLWVSPLYQLKWDRCDFEDPGEDSHFIPQPCQHYTEGTYWWGWRQDWRPGREMTDEEFVEWATFADCEHAHDIWGHRGKA